MVNSKVPIEIRRVEKEEDVKRRKRVEEVNVEEVKLVIKLLRDVDVRERVVKEKVEKKVV
jgi:hypothetical protein